VVGKVLGKVIIHDEIDTVLGKAIEELREKYKAMPQVDFAGQVAGLLMATAVKMAKAGGCPRRVFEQAVLAKIKDEYKSR